MSDLARRRMRAVLCGIAALICSSSIAPAAQAAAPSLQGTFLGAEPGTTFRPGTVTTEVVSCNPFDGSGRVTFRATGVSVDNSVANPTSYPGTYVEEGEFVVTGTPFAPGSIARTLSSYTSTFTITSGDKRVTGTRQLKPGAVTQGACDQPAGYTKHVLGFATTAYTAEIRSDDGELLGRDAGTSDSTVVDTVGPSGQAFHRDIRYVSADADGDGFYDGVDNCPAVANEDQANADGDAEGDACDADRDGDEVANGDDNCADVSNAGQANADGDAEGDACDADRDGDEVENAADNCADVANAGQADLDGDGQGDECDSDRDGDEVANGVDNCADLPNDQVDTDGDGRGDACDADDDNDGAADAQDTCPAVANESQRDSDGDGQGDACDDAFDSTDGLTAGGGWIAGPSGKVHLSYSAISKAGRITGIGELREGTNRVRLVNADGYTQADGRSVVVGDALVEGARVRYRLETVDAGKTDTVELEAGDSRWAGTLAGGNLDVKR